MKTTTKPRAADSAHRPGPWILSSGTRGNTGYFDATLASKPGGVAFARIEQNVLGRTYPELVANVHLIAAAPELLAACQRLMKAEEEHRTLGGDFADVMKARNQARAAIAKAEGTP